MYVKVTAGGGPGPQGEFLTRVHPPLHFDFIAAKLGPEAKWDGDELVNPDIRWDDALKASIQYAHILEVRANNRTNYEQNEGTLAFRYVWWEDPDTGLTAVITTRNIFIVGDNGKTIDRV